MENSLFDLTTLLNNKLEDILKLRDKFILKQDKSYVSEGDLLVDKIVHDYYSKNYPDHEIISEEVPYAHNKEWEKNGNYIIVDPIDGTENFISGLREWGVGICIYTKGKHEASCIYLPELNEVVISGQPLKKFKSRIVGLSSSLTREDLAQLPNEGFEYRIIGCSMYNMLAAIKGSFMRFENVKGVNCWDILPGLNLALEHGLTCYVDDKPYNGEILFPTQKYRIKLINQ